MKKNFIFPIVFVIGGLCFTTYSFLNTFIIPVEYNVDLSASNESAPERSFVEHNSEEEVVVDDKYYEPLTKAQINALFTPQKVFEYKKHYSDPDICIDITTDRFEDYSDYYVADIRLKSFAYFKTALAKDTAGENINEKTSELCSRHKGVIAINGDTYGSQKSGYVIRNGVAIRKSKNLNRAQKLKDKSKAEDLAIYNDGTFEIFDENEVEFDEIAAKDPWQVFSFGPGLVDKGEKIIQKGDEVNTSASQNRNQRCAIGMVAPLHYVFVVSDGRIASSPGLSLYQMGKIMQEKLHCYTAYNFDGGGSATMFFDDGTGNANGNGALINYCTQELVGNKRVLPENPPIEEREVSDIVYIGKE